MPSNTPTDGRCNARTSRGFCQSRPVKGGTRCNRHGGYMQRFSQRLRHLDEAAQAEVDAAMDDPDLLDVRRPLALAEVVITNSPVVASEEAIDRLARRRVVREMGPFLLPVVSEYFAQAGDKANTAMLREAIEEILEPTAADRDEAALVLHERSMKLLSSYSKRQVEAVRQLEWSKAMRQQAVPFLQELGVKISQTLRRFVPEDQLPSAIEEVRKALMMTLGELATVDPKAVK